MCVVVAFLIFVENVWLTKISENKFTKPIMNILEYYPYRIFHFIKNM